MVEIRDLTAGYGGEPVLRGVTAHFEKGKFTAIIGPNGCGKSTLLRVLAGLLRPAEGVVQLAGKPLADYSANALARTAAFLPQNRGVPQLRVERFVLHGRFPHLGYPRRYRPADLAAARAAMEKAGIADLADRDMGELSGGERQKAYIAMALAQDTPLLLLDEPGNHLDILHRLQLMRLARSLADGGKTVVMVTHELSLGLERADSICLMDCGAVIKQESPEAIPEELLGSVFGVKAHRENGLWRFEE